MHPLSYSKLIPKNLATSKIIDERNDKEYGELYKISPSSSSAITSLQILGLEVNRASFCNVVINRLNLVHEATIIIELSTQQPSEQQFENKLLSLRKIFGDDFEIKIIEALRMLSLTHLANSVKFNGGIQNSISKNPDIYNIIILNLLKQELLFLDKLTKDKNPVAQAIAHFQNQINSKNYWFSLEEIHIFLKSHSYYKYEKDSNYHVFANGSEQALVIYEDDISYLGKKIFHPIVKTHQKNSISPIIRFEQQIKLKKIDQSQTSWLLEVKYTKKRFLCFSGGGAKLLSYAPLIKYLFKANMLDAVEKVAGTSAGSIISFMVAIHFDPLKLYSGIIEIIDFSKIKDSDILKYTIKKLTINHIREISLLLRNYLKERIDRAASHKQLIDDFCSITSYCADIQEVSIDSFYIPFKILTIFNRYFPSKYKELYIIATEVTSGKETIFSNYHTPETCIISAVIASSALTLPFIDKLAGIKFSAQEIAIDDKVLAFKDGGFTNNTPFQYFGDEFNERNSMVFLLDDTEKIKTKLQSNYVIYGNSQFNRVAQNFFAKFDSYTLYNYNMYQLMKYHNCVINLGVKGFKTLDFDKIQKNIVLIEQNVNDRLINHLQNESFKYIGKDIYEVLVRLNNNELQFLINNNNDEFICLCCAEIISFRTSLTKLRAFCLSNSLSDDHNHIIEILHSIEIVLKMRQNFGKLVLVDFFQRNFSLIQGFFNRKENQFFINNGDFTYLKNVLELAALKEQIANTIKQEYFPKFLKLVSPSSELFKTFTELIIRLEEVENYNDFQIINNQIQRILT